MIRSLTLWIRHYRDQKRSLPASTLMETVVAMTILLSVLTISLISLDRINRSVNPEVRYKAHLATNEVLYRDDLLLDQEASFEVQGYLVEKRVYYQGNALYRVELRVLSGSGRTIYDRVILKSNEIEM